MNSSAQTWPARSGGQSQNGGSEAAAGRPMRIAATRPKPRRCTTALTKWVVPITTASRSPRATSGCSPSLASAAMIPPVTSAVVGVLTACTASLLVPPTSTPIRSMLGPPIRTKLRQTGDASARAVGARNPKHIAGAVAVEPAAQHEQMIGQPVEIFERLGVDFCVLGQPADQTLGTPDDGPRQMQVSGGGAASRQDE